MLEQVNAIRRFNRFYTNFLGLLNETLLESPLTLTEGRILFEIYTLPDCSARELIEILNLDRGYMSRVLKRLERIGLIKRAVAASDKRVRSIMLTKDGKLLIQRIDRDANHHIGGALKTLDSTERKMLVNAMRDIERILSHQSIRLHMRASAQS